MTIASLAGLSVLLIPGLWLWLTVRLAEGLPEFGQENQVRFFILRFNSVLLSALGLLGIIACMINPFGLIVAPIALISLLIVLIIRRRASQERFVWALAYAADHGVEISNVAALLARQTAKIRGKKVEQFASMLEQGTPLLGTLGAVGIQLSPGVQLALATPISEAERIGSLREIVETDERYEQAVRGSTEASIYLISTAIVASIIAVFINIKIFRTFSQIAKESGGKATPVDRLIAWESGLGLNGIIGVVLFVMLLALLTALILIYMDILPRNFWPLSKSHALYNRAIVLGAIGRRIYQQQSPVEIARSISISHPYTEYRRLTEQLFLSLQRGESFEKSLFRTGLICQRDEQRLVAASNSNRLAEELKWIAEQKVTKAEFRWRIVSSWLLPLAYLLIGCGVYALAWSVFESLNEFIRMMDSHKG